MPRSTAAWRTRRLQKVFVYSDRPSLTIDRPAQLPARIAALDTIASVLPMGRRDTLADLLTDQDVETLRHLVNQAWVRTRSVPSPPIWPICRHGRSWRPVALFLGRRRSASAEVCCPSFMGPEKRLADPQHGMPSDVEDQLRVQGFLRAAGPHAPIRCAGGWPPGRR